MLSPSERQGLSSRKWLHDFDAICERGRLQASKDCYKYENCLKSVSCRRATHLVNFLVVYSACKEKRRKSDYDWTPQDGVMRAKSFRYLLRGFPRAVLFSD
jgi:hypothetical protein